METQAAFLAVWALGIYLGLGIVFALPFVYRGVGRIDPQPGFECYDATLEPRPVEARIPPLFRIYLRHGAKVCGPPAIDRRFRTIDYLVLFDVDGMNRRMFSTFFE